MSRRSRTILTLSVRVPVPVGKTQAWVLDNVTKLVRCDPAALICNFGPEVIVKLDKKETVYL